MEKVDFKIPKSAYDDLMKYFRGQGLNKSDGFNQLVHDKLAMINTSRRTIFNHIEMIMLIPRTEDLDELDEKSRIIALYNTKTDFIDEFNYEEGFNKSLNYQYDLRDFDEIFFPMGIINSTKESQVKGVNQKDLWNWESFYERLDELYDLKSNEWYFVRCPLNNYLDVNREGQFQHPQYRGDHLGIYIFDYFNEKRIYLFLNWDYSHEHGNISFVMNFGDLESFMYYITDSEYKSLRDFYDKLQTSKSDKKKLEDLIATEEKILKYLKKQYDKM